MDRHLEERIPDPGHVDGADLRRFEAQAAHWWDRRGAFGALHDINPLRVRYVADRMPLPGARIVDVGCGGGLLTEALARKGARMTGIDLGRTAVAVASGHAARGGLSIRYRRCSAEALASEAPGAFDGVVCMELLEHVPDPAALVGACTGLARPGGHLFFATLNRTPAARFLAIFMAETVLRIVERGTHRYDRFIRPGELASWAGAAGLSPADLSGFLYLPFVRYSRIVRAPLVNYLAHFRKPH
jgi:2-polyprenyl-6-hydroxyphenyl methylase/3-demethylubiquinone-9 3-methyltransferase